ncbi:MAG TPA: capsule biosynthesis protein CapA, partial [Paracoccaceae bacterium]|nr:capsule biosynthesis protein CapA [Paracoccaceae bacterium]
MRVTGETRVFLLLQGPHGPFFHQLGRMLARTGAQVWRVGFNRGDRALWFDAASFIPYRGTVEGWDDALAAILTEKGVTDL